LHLDPHLAGGVLRQLARDGLAAPAGAGWSLTEAGRAALAEGVHAERALERRAFHFVENRPVGRPPHFLRLRRPAAPDPVPPGGWTFDPGLVDACARQDPAWKRRYGFPADVRGVAPPGGEGEAGVPDWQRVVLDRAERLTAALAEVNAEEGSGLLGFAVDEGAWRLEAESPALALGPGWEDVFPEVAADPPPEAWREAWRVWCQPRALPAGDVGACGLERSGHVLWVRAPRRLVERLRADRSDALKGEAWLLAGEGRTRAAAQVEVGAEGA
jgi:hypothetical protein